MTPVAQGSFDVQDEIVANFFTGIEENNLNFNVFPNPCTTNLIIKHTLNGQISYTIHSATAEYVSGGRLSIDGIIDVADLAAGFYTIQLQDGQTISSQIFTKN